MASIEPLLSSWQDEKAKPLFENGYDDQQLKKRVKARNPFTVVGSVILMLIALAAIRMIHVRIMSTQPEPKGFICVHPEPDMSIKSFKEITPSEKLKWHRCFGYLRCARLTVPMDYNRPLNVSKNNPEVDIALLMVPGRNHTNSGKYSKSPLLMNPGGPGGSGVFFAQYAGHELQQIVGLDQDIIGFDPRGIGETTPVADCFAFPSSGKNKELTGPDISRGYFHKFLWALAGQETGLINSSIDSLEKIDNRDRATAELCQTKDAMYGEDSILRHVSTPAVARDMLSIVDAWDAWMEEREEVDSKETNDNVNFPEVLEEDKSLDTKGKLVYWGFSYGTLLGATFAAMFPDRVGRVILDGVVDADYYVAPVWEESLLDTDKVMASFFYFCHKAGKRCALYREGDSEIDIQIRFQEANDKLKQNPIKGVSATTRTPTVFTHDMLKLFIFHMLYSPIAAFPIMASILDTLHRGDESSLLSTFPTANAADPDMFCSNHIFSGYEGRDAQLAIMCSDKRYPLNESIPNLQMRFEKMALRSSFADVWMTLMIGCDSWSIPATDPPMRWDDHPAHAPKPINTSFPLLFLSNSQDPVTPLKAGVKMARKFVDAGLVEQHGAGHCSFAAASFCTLKHIQAYVTQGKVPPHPQWGPDGKEIAEGQWERCTRDDWPWKWEMEEGGARDAPPLAEGATAEEQLEEDAVMRAWRRIRNVSSTYLKFWGTRNGLMEVHWRWLTEGRGEVRG